MRRWLSGSLAALAALGIGAAAVLVAALPSQAQGTGNPRCVPLFQNYDTQLRLFGTDPRGRGRTARPPVVSAAQWVRNGGCLTFSSALAGMTQARLKPAGRAPAGGAAPISPLVYLHAGVVTDSDDDASSIAFFESHGFPARSIGAPLLGRRIYVGPFGSEAEFDAARDLALQAGFAYPYAARF